MKTKQHNQRKKCKNLPLRDREPEKKDIGKSYVDKDGSIWLVQKKNIE